MSLNTMARQFALETTPAANRTNPTWLAALDEKVNNLATEMVACFPEDEGDPEAEELIMDYIFHTTHACLGDIHPNTGRPYDMPGGLDYPEFSEKEFGIMDKFVAWVVIRPVMQ